jgi:hypothetical protein
MGGLGLGHGVVSLGSAAIIVGLVAYMAVTGKDVMVAAGGIGPGGPGSR